MDEVQAKIAFERALREQRPQFGSFFLARLLDLDITYSDDTCMIRFPVHDFLFNPQGSLHGGIIGTVIDISMGHLIHHSYGQGGATMELKVQYLRPLLTGQAICRGRFTKRGSRIAFLESHLEDASGRLVAHGTGTWLCKKTAEEPVIE